MYQRTDRPARLGALNNWLAHGGAQPLRHDYRQTAWVGTVALSGAEPGLAVERFTRQGPVALLPLPPAIDGAQPGLSRASLVSGSYTHLTLPTNTEV